MSGHNENKDDGHHDKYADSRPELIKPKKPISNSHGAGIGPFLGRIAPVILAVSTGNPKVVNKVMPKRRIDPATSLNCSLFTVR